MSRYSSKKWAPFDGKLLDFSATEVVRVEDVAGQWAIRGGREGLKPARRWGWGRQQLFVPAASALLPEADAR